MVLNEKNLVIELKRWFDKSINDIDLTCFTQNIAREILIDFISDYHRYFPKDKEIILEKIINRIELQGILLYRIARYFYIKGNQFFADSFSSLGRFLAGFEIYYSAEIGKGLKINHGLGLVVGARVKIGNNVLLHQGVTLGDKDGGRPIISDNVIIYAGAKVLGNIRIGEHAVIGSNCVCFIDVPENKRVVGIPARII